MVRACVFLVAIVKVKELPEIFPIIPYQYYADRLAKVAQQLEFSFDLLRIYAYPRLHLSTNIL